MGEMGNGELLMFFSFISRLKLVFDSCEASGDLEGVVGWGSWGGGFGVGGIEGWRGSWRYCCVGRG